MSNSPWSNRQFPNDSYYNGPTPQPVPPPASFTIGGQGDPNLVPQPVPPPSATARPAVFGKPLASPGPGIQDSRGLPSKLYECQGTIVIYQPLLHCGIMSLSSAGDTGSVYCFFLSSQVSGPVQLRKGTRILANARLVRSQAKVPYLASTVWGLGMQVRKGVMEDLIAPAHPGELDKYDNLSEDLSFELDDVRNKDVIAEEEYERRGGQDRKRAASPDRLSGMSGHSSSSRYEGDVGKRGRMEMEAPSMSSPSSSSMMNVDEEFPEWGVMGVVDKYLSSTTGVMYIRNANKRVLFHVNQVWMPTPDGEGSAPFLETIPLIKLPNIIEVGQELKLNARRISGCNFNLQATAVWKRKDPPINYKSEDLLQNLNLTLNQHIFCETGDSLYKTNPLSGTLDIVVSAKVQEYFSFEMGFLKLDSGDRGVVLFHLNQVWTEGSNAVPYREVQNMVLPEHLPVGSSVMVNMRKLQASQGSSLLYQATLVWPRKMDEETEGKLLPGYISMYGPHEKRVSFVNELNDHHDLMKSILKLNLSSNAPDFVPVHAVLNGLPHQWQAQVVAAIDDDLGVIKISHCQGIDLSPKVPSLLALFHVEDVFDADGIPAIKSANVTMPNMIDSFVDLTARPMCLESEPQKIMDLQRSLNERNGDKGSVPILQAIVVCVKMHPTSDIVFTGFPKPTPLREHPGCFVSGPTEFYLNPLLNCKLDLKLKRYFRLDNRPSLPYRTNVKSKGNINYDDVVRDLKKVDINRTERFLNGEFPSDIPTLPVHASASLPKLLEFQEVKLKYLHHRKMKDSKRLMADCGVVEICINPMDDLEEKITTYAFFSLSGYKFFTPKDYFASDLVNIMPIYSKERFAVNAKLAFPNSKIPYLVHNIWNENLRQDQNASVPQMSDSDMSDKEHKSCLNTIGDITKEIVAAVPRPGLTAIPMDIGKTKNTKSFDKSKVIMDGENLVERLENMTGIVESVLSPHIAIVTIKPKFSSTKYRVLCSSDDIFDLKFKGRIHPRDFQQKNPFKFSSSSEVWELTARRKKYSLQGLLRPGHKVKLNAVPLFTHPNPADVHYVSSGVLVGKNSLENPVPVECIKSSSLLSKTWKEFFHNVVSSLNTQIQFKNKNLPNPPPKMQEFMMRGHHKHKLQLRAEYSKDLGGVVQLPTPVRTKQMLEGPPVWKDILNDQYGQVIRIMDKNYGIAAGFVAHGGRNGQPEFEPFQMVFDTFDVYIGYHDCNHLGKTLADVMQVGDFIKFNGVRVDPAKSGESRDIRYLATALVVAKTSDKVKRMNFPSDIAQIETIDQVAKTKISNFKIVAGVMNTTKVINAEKEILDDIRRGKLGSKFMELSNLSGCTDDVLQETDGSDDEATCVEANVKQKEQTKIKDDGIIDIQTLVSDLKPKELRKLIMSYIEVVSKLPDEASKDKFDIQNIVKTLNSEKTFRFFVDFFISLGHACLTAEKGIKVGHVFLTQTQVKAIRLKGIKCEKDIDLKLSEKTKEKVEMINEVTKPKEDITPAKSVETNVDKVQEISKENDDGKELDEIEEIKIDGGLQPSTSICSNSADLNVSAHENVLNKYSTTELRKFIFSFMKMIDKTVTLGEAAKNGEVTEEVAKELFAAITFKCKASPVVDGKRQSFKLKNIFMNSTWAEKIVVFDFQ